MASINFNYKGKTYELGFTRESVKQMENSGFVLSKLTEKPVVMIPALFYGSFAAHNRGIKRALVDDAFESVVDKEGLIDALLEMYLDTVNTLTEAAENDGKNATWERA